MSLIPGWDSVAGAHTWSNIWFWGSIVALILLGVTEVVSHRYSDRKDELAAVEQRDAQRQHDDEMKRLQLETAEANERAADANARAEEARLELAKFKAARELNDEQRSRIAGKLRPFGKLPFDFSMLIAEPETLGLMEAILATLGSAGWEVKDWHDPGRPVITLPGKPQIGVSIGAVSGVFIQIDDSKTAEWGAAVSTLIAALNAEGISATGKRITDKTETPTAIHIYVGKKP